MTSDSPADGPHRREAGPRQWALVRATYEREGYAIIRKVVDPELVVEMSEHVEWLQRRHPDLRPEQMDYRWITDDPFWVRVVADPALLDIAEAFVGPNVALFASRYFCKAAGDGLEATWHQDGPYWPLQPMEAVTLWVAVDPSNRGNGCMQVIPGSHRLGPLPIHKHPGRRAIFGSGADTTGVDLTRAQDIVLEPGDVSLHHPFLVHGSGPNRSDGRRCGLQIRYIPTTTRIASEEPWETAMLLRGSDAGAVNRYVSPPRFDVRRHMSFRGCAGWPAPWLRTPGPRRDAQEM